MILTQKQQNEIEEHRTKMKAIVRKADSIRTCIGKYPVLVTVTKSSVKQAINTGAFDFNHGAELKLAEDSPNKWLIVC